MGAAIQAATLFFLMFFGKQKGPLGSTITIRFNSSHFFQNQKLAEVGSPKKERINLNLDQKNGFPQAHWAISDLFRQARC